MAQREEPRPVAPPELGSAEPLRSDAARNRERILKAARALFAEHGLNVPLEAIAERADVGIATLYRRFPTRDELIAASFEDKMRRYSEAVRDALELPDGWSAFCQFVNEACAMQASDIGLRDVLTLTFPESPSLEEQRRRTADGFAEIVRRAQDEGTLRNDFVTQDFVLLLLSNAGVISGMRNAAPDAWKRHVALMIQAYRADHAAPLPDPPTHEHVWAAMNRPDRG
ncbi:hypothetical protein A2J03_15385 [Rhodococcus sp. EPR-157]|uniref:TetR/AcrR family transcriptional regulator n=1 Tax=Rhodococcus sp. EPR-157 TaxID=1813677 RepID=UPI0007BC4C2F|nr:TetR/AcrR family transcriptional regulator [Rhodococcus sp. EPR-157]KZF13377.1 hypothetical protein A2J03_15385 [Rhodococcus sp. EPR-157]